jgi:hypothetical protein
MCVNVRATGNRLHGFADWPAILDDRLVQSEVSHCNFVSERHIVEQLDFADRFSLEGERANSGPFSKVHYGHADIIFRFVQ